MKRFAILLAGCGNQDGTEITEAVSCLITLSGLGAHWDFFAPDGEFEALNYETRQPLGQKRSYRLEAMRITRQPVKSWMELKPDHFDALVIPGGSGIGRRLSSWFENQSNMTVDPVLNQIVQAFHQMSKPICAICVAPILVGYILRHHQVTLTCGLDPQYKSLESAWGIHVEPCPSTDFVTDRFHRLVTTPAFMNPHVSFFDVFSGIRLALQETWEMA